MTDFPQKIVEDRRLLILQILNGMIDGSLSDSNIQSGLDEMHVKVGRDTVRSDLAWLQSVGAVTISVLKIGAHVGEITDLGREHVERRRVIPGVKRPDRGS